MKKTIFTLATIGLLLASCNGKTEEKAPEQPAQTEETTTADVPTETAEFTLNAGDDMKYDLSEMKVKAGQKVKVTLHHTGKSAKTAMGHNFVLLTQDIDFLKFAEAAIAAADNEYIPKKLEADIIAHTKLIGGGETAEIEFTAPEKGTYQFLCSFPGHAAMMNGKFIVE